MGGLRIVAEKHESRRFDRDLVRKENLQPAVIELRRRVHVLGILDDIVENISRDATVEGVKSFRDGGKDLVDPLPCFRADE